MAGVPRTGPGLRLLCIWCMCAVWAAALTPISSAFWTVWPSAEGMTAAEVVVLAEATGAAPGLSQR